MLGRILYTLVPSCEKVVKRTKGGGADVRRNVALAKEERDLNLQRLLRLYSYEVKDVLNNYQFSPISEDPYHPQNEWRNVHGS